MQAASSEDRKPKFKFDALRTSDGTLVCHRLFCQINCVNRSMQSADTHTHTHTHTYVCVVCVVDFLVLYTELVSALITCQFSYLAI